MSARSISARLVVLALACGLASQGAAQTVTITEYPIPTTNTQPFFVAAGADGALWFTEFSGNAIGRATTTGAITSFSVTRASAPAGIVSGPDGALWFTDYYSSTIARLTTAGVFSFFSTNAGGPYGIASGSDGNLWFADVAG